MMTSKEVLPDVSMMQPVLSNLRSDFLPGFRRIPMKKEKNLKIYQIMDSRRNYQSKVKSGTRENPVLTALLLISSWIPEKGVRLLNN
jgi:hypothetical protein